MSPRLASAKPTQKLTGAGGRASAKLAQKWFVIYSENHPGRAALYDSMRGYRRRLPHLDAPGVPTFVTWRLRGSLPRERIFPHEHMTSGDAFAIYDRLLDFGRVGPTYLVQPQIAALVKGQLWKVVESAMCRLHAYVIMPNHVHVLWTPLVSHAELIRRVKGPTAVGANKLLGRTREPFWQAEYFDRQVKSPGEFKRIQHYIEWNPVKAALAARPEEYPWSSAWDEVRRG